MLGPIVALAVNKFGFKWSSVFGAVMCSSAMIGCLLVKEFLAFQLFYGIATGIGSSFLYVPANTCTGFYFQKRKSLAFGIASAGANIGLVLAMVYGAINNSFNMQGIYLFNAGLCFSLIPLFILFYPNKFEVRKRSVCINQTKEANTEKFEEMYGLKHQLMIILKDDVWNHFLGSKRGLSHQWMILLKADVWSHLLANFFQGAGHGTLLFFMPQMASDILDVSKYMKGFLLSLLGIVGIPARILVGWLADQEWVNPFVLHFLGMIGGAVCNLIYPLANSYWLMAVITGVQSFILALYSTPLSACQLKLVNIQQFNLTSGLAFCFQGLGTIIAPPVVRLVYEDLMEKDIIKTIRINAAIYALGSMFALITFFVQKFRRDALYQVK